MNHALLKAVFLIFQLILCKAAYSQIIENKTDRYNAWIGVGTGVYVFEEGNGVGQSITLDFAIQKNNSVFLLRGNIIKDTNLLKEWLDSLSGIGCSFSSECNSNIESTSTYRAFGVLYGFAINKHIIALGIEDVSINTKFTGGVPPITMNVTGVALDYQYMVNFSKNYRVGLRLQGNINGEDTHIGAMLSFNFSIVE